MSADIIVAVISAVATIAAVIISARATQKQVQADLKTSDAVQNEKIDQLRKEVEKHNNFASRIPVIEEQIKVANNRIHDLEEKVF